MRFYKLLLIVALILPTVLWSGPRPREGISYQDGILFLSDRRFAVSDLSQVVEEQDWKFNLRQSAWLAPVLNRDSVVQDWNVELIWAGVLGTELIHKASEISQKPSAEQVTEPSRQFSGYDVFTVGSGHIYFFPKSSSLRFSASCGRELDSEDLNICHIHVVYPYDSYVVLRAHKFFPGVLHEVVPDIEDIAVRMVEIAICLDVTDQSDAEREAALQQLGSAAELSECELQIGS